MLGEHMSIFQPIFTPGEYYAGLISARVFQQSPGERKRREDLDRLCEAHLSFPNHDCGYVRREKVSRPINVPTPDELFAELKAAYAEPVVAVGGGNGGTPPRLRRGRTKRTRVVGIQVYGKPYWFNGPPEHVPNRKRMSVAMG